MLMSDHGARFLPYAATPKRSTVQVRFASPVYVTGIKLGSVPIAAGGPIPFIRIFAHDLTSLSSARYECVREDGAPPERAKASLQLPEMGAGALTVRLEATLTDHVVLRGRYQTLPVAIYGYELDKIAVNTQYLPPLKHAPALTLSAALPDTHLVLPSTDPQPRSAMLSADAGTLDSALGQQGIQETDAELGPGASAAVKGLVRYWRRVKTSETRMAALPPPSAVLHAIKASADALCIELTRRAERSVASDASECAAATSAAAGGDMLGVKPESGTSVAGAADQPGMAWNGMLEAARGALDDDVEGRLDPADGTEAVHMAIAWCAMLVSGARMVAGVDCGAAGMQAAVLLCSVPR